MLTQTPVELTYLTNEQLGITEEERTALLWVREQLNNGNIQYSEVNYKEDFDIDTPFENLDTFNMAYTICGSVGCICGWMRKKLGYHFDLLHKSLTNLFLPFEFSNFNINELTPKLAVKAIDFWMQGAQKDCWKFATESAL